MRALATIVCILLLSLSTQRVSAGGDGGDGRFSGPPDRPQVKQQPFSPLDSSPIWDRLPDRQQEGLAQAMNWFDGLYGGSNGDAVVSY